TDPVKELAGISRPILRVQRSATRKVILEFHVAEYALAVRVMLNVKAATRRKSCHAETNPNTQTRKNGRNSTSKRATNHTAFRMTKPRGERGQPSTRFTAAVRSPEVEATESLRITSR